MNRELLPDEAVFRADGHLGDAALAAMADGQDVLPQTASVHLDGCDACTHRLGEAALLSLGTAEAFERATVELAPLSARSRRAPTIAILSGLAVALLAALPKLALAPELVRGIPAALPLLARNIVVIVRAAVSAIEARAVVMSLVASLVLVAVGFVIARSTPALTGASS